MKDDMEVYEFIFVRESDKAIGVCKEGEEGRLIWLPKSQIDYEEKPQRGEVIEVEVPDWLAIEKDL